MQQPRRRWACRKMKKRHRRANVVQGRSCYAPSYAQVGSQRSVRRGITRTETAYVHPHPDAAQHARCHARCPSTRPYCFACRLGASVSHFGHLGAVGAGSQVVGLRLVGAPWWVIGIALVAVTLPPLWRFLNDRVLIGRGPKHILAWAEVEKQRRNSSLRLPR